METKSYDVAIVGGSAAGLSAALVLGRARRSVVVFDTDEPRNAPAAHMQGFLSRDGMPPSELLAIGRSEALRYGTELVADRVVDVEPGFTIRRTSGEAVTARRILLATGAIDELPDIPGVRARWGRDFLHCPYCHGWEVRDRAIGVFGTGPGSAEHAHLLRQWSSDVVFFTHTCDLAERQHAELTARGIRVVDGRVAGLTVEDDRIQAVEMEGGGAIPRDSVFIRPRLQPRSGLALSLGCETDDGGFIRVDGAGKTSVPGLWAAGNVANPRAQVITSAGEGSAAAIAINADLVAEDIHNATQQKESR